MPDRLKLPALGRVDAADKTGPSPEKGGDVLIIGGFLIGAIWGPLRAVKRGGRKLDALHYGAYFAIIGTLLGLLATIVIDRLT